ncbi:MAG: FAD-dependent oxidoreductase [Desulfobacterales bacterium]|nr:FAD-dependent oxidoreductase [Desulfobacterales bacterium]
MPLFPFDGDRILSSDDAVNLPALPKSIIMIGGGVIGCEFACIFQELGSGVSVIEALPHPRDGGPRGLRAHGARIQETEDLRLRFGNSGKR